MEVKQAAVAKLAMIVERKQREAYEAFMASNSDDQNYREQLYIHVNALRDIEFDLETELMSSE